MRIKEAKIYVKVIIPTSQGQGIHCLLGRGGISPSRQPEGLDIGSVSSICCHIRYGFLNMEKLSLSRVDSTASFYSHFGYFLT